MCETPTKCVVHDFYCYINLKSFQDHAGYSSGMLNKTGHTAGISTWFGGSPKQNFTTVLPIRRLATRRKVFLDASRGRPMLDWLSFYILRLEPGKHCFYLCFKEWDVIFCCQPYLLYIYTKLIVYELITHSGHIFPWNMTKIFAGFL